MIGQGSKADPFFSILNKKNITLTTKPHSRYERFCLYLYGLCRKSKIAQNSLLALMYASPLIALMGFISIVPVNLLSIGAFSVGFGFLFPLAFKTIRYFQCLQSRQAYLDKHEFGNKPNFEHPKFTSRHQTFNHVFSFVLHEGAIWYAQRHEGRAPEWKILYFHGLNTAQADNIILKADGENLMAFECTGSETVVHFKKVLKEKREKGERIYTSLCDEPVSKYKWFHLPYAQYLKPYLYFRKLTVPSTSMVTMSHAGDFKKTTADASGKTHKVWRITTVYELRDRQLILYDPYVSNETVIKIDVPDNIKKVHAIDVAASHVAMLVELESGFAVFSRLVDYDVLGLNPALRYTYDKDAKKGRLLPYPGWKAFFLPFETMSDYISVVQTGEGDKGIQIFVKAQDPTDSEYHYHMRDLHESAWHVVGKASIGDNETEIHAIRKAFCPPLIWRHDQPFQLNGNPYKHACMLPFRPDEFRQTLTLVKPDDSTVNCVLIKHTNLIASFFGYHAEKWVLSVSPDEHSSGLFAGQNVIEVDVKHSQGKVSISACDASFSFELSPLNVALIRADKPLRFSGEQTGVAMTSGNTVELEATESLRKSAP